MESTTHSTKLLPICLCPCSSWTAQSTFSLRASPIDSYLNFIQIMWKNTKVIWSRLLTHASSSDWQRSILDLGLELIYASLFLSFFFAFFCSYQFGPWFAKVVVATPAHFSGKKVTLKCKTPIRNRRPCCCWKNKRRLGY